MNKSAPYPSSRAGLLRGLLLTFTVNANCSRHESCWCCSRLETQWVRKEQSGHANFPSCLYSTCFACKIKKHYPAYMTQTHTNTHTPTHTWKSQVIPGVIRIEQYICSQQLGSYSSWSLFVQVPYLTWRGMMYQKTTTQQLLSRRRADNSDPETGPVCQWLQSYF